MSILLGILTVILIFVSIFIVLVVLAQKSKDGGMGAALGGGAAEAAFGADTSNVLSKSTIYAAILFFILAFTLYLGRIYERGHARAGANNALPAIAAPAIPPATAPATTPAADATSAPQPAVTVPAASAAATPAAGTTPPATTTPAPTPPAK
jgi:preprotein translocase subunit SecG